MFEEAVDSLPAELTVFKDLFGPSFIRAIKTVLNDCATRLKQLDASYEPTMEEMKKKYEDAMNIYEEQVNVNPEDAALVQENEMRQLKNFVEGANRAKEEERQKIKEQCQLRKQDLLRNRMFAVLSVFRDIYRADPDNLLLVTDQLKNFITKLEEGLKECRKMANSLNVDDDIMSLCDDEAIDEAIEFIKTVLLTLPSQVQKGFPDIPGDTEGEITLDDGSTPDIFVGDIPNILMPGPVIIDQLPEDDDDASGTGPIDVIDGSGDPTTAVPVVTTVVTDATTDAPVTTDAIVTTDSPVTTGTTVTTDATVTTGTTVTTDATVTTGSTATTDATVTTEAETTDPTAVVGSDGTDVTQVTNDTIAVSEDVVLVEVATTQPVVIDDSALAAQTAGNPERNNDDDDDDDKDLLPLYIALLVCIGMLVAVMVIMIIVVLMLRHKARQGGNESAMSEDDKLSLMKEGYVNPTYQFFDKSTSTH